jgi:hypothetical protein
MREAAQQIVHRSGIELAAILCIQLGLHVDERDGLIAVICDYEKNRHVTVVAIVDAEDRSLVFDVIRVDGDGNLLHGVLIVRWVSSGGLGRGHDKLFGGHGGESTEQHESAPNRQPSNLRCRRRMRFLPACIFHMY